MIEIVCPSCGARYQVPDDSIGPDGRKVTCSSCSHKWRAYPSAAVEEPPAAAETPVAAESPEAVTTAGGDTAEGGDEAPRQPEAGGGREEQMDAIRRMLDDLKRNAETDPEPEPEPEKPRPAPPQQTRRTRDEDDALEPADSGDPLRSRINQVDKSGATARPSNYDAAKLRKMHERRAKRLQRAKERKRKSSAFATGFTLVAAVAAVMVGLYVLRPQIIAASPEMEPAINEYVVTVDRYRLALDDATAEWRGWVTDKVGELTGGEEGQTDQSGQSGQQQEAETAAQ